MFVSNSFYLPLYPTRTTEFQSNALLTCNPFISDGSVERIARSQISNMRIGRGSRLPKKSFAHFSGRGLQSGSTDGYKNWDASENRQDLGPEAAMSLFQDLGALLEHLGDMVEVGARLSRALLQIGTEAEKGQL